MKLIRTILLVGCFVVVACANENQDDNKSGNNDAPPNGNLFLVNQKSQVQNPDLLFGTWESETRSESDRNVTVDFILRAQFVNNIMKLAAKCVFRNGPTIYVQTQSEYEIRDERLVILDESQRNQISGDYECSVSLPKIPYRRARRLDITDGKFQGPNGIWFRKIAD